MLPECTHSPAACCATLTDIPSPFDADETAAQRESRHTNPAATDSDEDEPEFIDVRCDEQAAGPPLEVGDTVRLYDATVGEQYERGYRTMRVFVESHILYE